MSMPPLLRLITVLSLIALGAVLVRNITDTLEGRPIYPQTAGFRFNPGYERPVGTSTVFPAEEPLSQQPVDVRHVTDDVTGNRTPRSTN